MVHHRSDAEKAEVEELRWLDRVLQRWRIKKAKPFIDRHDRVLDVGCADGALFAQLNWIESGLGIDPAIEDGAVRGIPLRRGAFPADLDDEPAFDVVTALAVFEHVPAAAQGPFVMACARALSPGGRVIVTVPAPAVDHLIEVLQKVRLLRGMEADEHWGFHPAETAPVFVANGFNLTVQRRFQLGLNHLFVFTRR